MDQAVSDYLDRYGVLDATRAFLERPQHMFIGGEWIAAGKRDAHEVHEFSTGGVITHIPAGTVEDVDAAVKAARHQFENGEWSRLKPLEREILINRLADLMEANIDELAEIESIDVGKPRELAREIDVQGAIDTLRYFAGWATKITGRTAEPAALPGSHLALVLKEPVGVVGSIAPWNFPLQTMIWKLGATLATGCTTVIKPAELTSLSTLRFAELVQQAGIPDGVINVVTGTGSTVGQAIASHPGIDKVTFTGSTAVGKLVGTSAIQNMAHLTLELGGKSPVLVFEDVDIKQAAAAVAEGIFFNAGQVCDAGSRAYIHRSIYREFLAELADYAKGLKIGPGLAPESFICPMVGKKQFETVTSYIRKGIEEGAELICGGLPNQGESAFVEPTVFADCSNSMAVMREEIFGPVLATASFETEEEAIALANDSEYGLASAIYTRDIDRVFRVAPKLKAGSVKVNRDGQVDPALPFGGYKQSGVGKDLGPEQLDHFLETKTVWISLS
ncbi:aldehyde dehydrogenase family protein [Altererythrobacter sp.]|uniref:aldehyde dehydrogenase family protein n=1 Tax=Altererythrobacter sp. TaxID=1872480 RepID=UPI003D034E56